MEQGYFITGTDTNVGKTWVAVMLMEHFKSKGKSVVGFKPVASGCDLVDGKWVNSDALLLQAHGSISLDYGEVNPYAYQSPVSPHIAGKDDPVVLREIINKFNKLKQKAEVVVVEGAGGWYSPVNDHQQNSDLARELELPVILIVAVKLGCINHALLTFRAIARDGVHCLGWVAVQSDPCVLEKEKIVMTLQEKLDMPLIAAIPYSESLDISKMHQEISL